MRHLNPQTLLLFTTLSLSSPTLAKALPHKHHPIPADDFVYVSNLRLKDSRGLHYLTGLNYWACMNLAAPASQGGNYTRLTTELDQMAAKGVNHLRIMAASEGAATPQPFRMAPALLDAPGVYNEEVFRGLDVCLDEMGKRGMRATMTLNNEWQWSGGFAQWVSWSQGNEQIPYPPSWNLSAAPQRATPRTGWGNYTVEGVDAESYGAFTEYANRFYTDGRAEEWWKEHVRTVVGRRNTVNGRLYGEDATIMTWQLANEPQPQAPLGNEGPFNKFLVPNPDDLLVPWVERISKFIRELAPKQLVSVGLESKQGEWYFKQVHNFSTVDYATTHCWVQNWGIYDMYNSSEANLKQAQDFATAFMRNSSQWAVDIGKPVFLEEFGMARDNWENKGKEYPYLSSAGTTHKDAYFNSIIGAVIDEFTGKGAYVGTCPWAYGGIWRPETQYVNDFGLVWAGDPPHESPGWYDLYDTDEAMNIVSDQQKYIAEWLKDNNY
ncbi:glycoside hydrolase family 5 protein [Aaosphaeria arxii CBS 175.79]|uniref:mannan endo-1,4-beta-mannosidase n=1 Tax=Aaosphaeria arxii CBS 175.79 TaxID=1450172 RepID=A0A6A5XA20_9PLEO|nr:glycoside hydrolase family 5 protein [Aaosphaeria arxii CBS 175.79]KAF2009617.1 glycoside hydrolase family 5 protein [Aaosphaeria arxii CBS 175.79]